MVILIIGFQILGLLSVIRNLHREKLYPLGSSDLAPSIDAWSMAEML